MTTDPKILLGYSHTPTPLPAAPRAVRFREDVKWNVYSRRVTCVLFFLILALPITVASVWAVLWLECGVRVPGIVTAVDITSPRGVNKYSIVYSYGVGDRTFSNSTLVAKSVYLDFQSRLTQGPVRCKVDVQFFRLGPWHADGLPQYSSPTSDLVIYILGSLVFLVISFQLFYFSWILQWRAARICRLGIPTTGTLTSKDVERTGAKRGFDYFIRYEYATPEGPIRLKQYVLEVRWDAVHEGQKVTVIYDLKRPGRSVVYEAGNFEITT